MENATTLQGSGIATAEKGHSADEVCKRLPATHDFDSRIDQPGSLPTQAAAPERLPGSARKYIRRGRKARV